MHPAAARQTGDPLLVRLASAVELYSRSIAFMRRAPQTFERDSWGLPQPRPDRPSPPLAEAKATSLLASSGEGKGKRQQPQDYYTSLPGRWLTNAAGMANTIARGAVGVKGMDAPLQARHSSALPHAHKRPHPELYRPKIARAVVRTEPTVKASSPHSFPYAPAGSLL